MKYNKIIDETIDLFHLKKLPQFYGMSEDEIRTLFIRMKEWEEKQWDEEQVRKRNQERAADSAYLEESKDPELPEGSVKIQVGIIITPRVVDDHHFASREDLARQKGTMKMFLDEKKKIYV